MAWQDELRQATFRGVPFFVESTEAALGRRNVVHEYPLRDKPFVEDLGLKARGLTLEAYVLGVGYIATRDALMAALDQAGPGKLIHPYHGERTVSIVGEPKMRETTAEGGMARFTITCIEAGEFTFPSASADTAELVELAADDATFDVASDFSDSFTLDGFPEFVSTGAQDLVGNALAAIEGVAGSFPNLANAQSLFASTLGAARSSLAALLQSPSGLASSLLGQIGGLGDLIARPEDGVTMLRGLFTFGSQELPVPSTTPSRVQQAKNQAAVIALVQRAAVIEAARSSSRIDFAGYTQAVTLREELAERLDVLAEAASNDQVYDSLVTLRAAMIKDITVRGADLARTVTITPQATQPALVLAYALYDDATRDAEIVARNGVRHPGFVPGGRALEVLADA